MADDRDEKKVPYESIKLEIVSKDGNIVFSEDVVMANFPGEAGFFTVLPGHTPFLSSLKVGEIKFQKNTADEKYIFATVIGGFCEVTGEQINVITNASEIAESIDISRVESAKKRAEDRLRARGEDIDIARAEAALQRSLIRLSVLNSNKHQN